VKREPKNPTAHQILGSVHAARKEIPAARAEYGKALELNPTFLAAAGGLARLDIAEGKPRRAPTLRTDCREGSEERTGAAGTRRGDGGNRRDNG